MFYQQTGHETLNILCMVSVSVSISCSPNYNKSFETMKHFVLTNPSQVVYNFIIILPWSFEYLGIYMSLFLSFSLSSLSNPLMCLNYL